MLKTENGGQSQETGQEQDTKAAVLHGTNLYPDTSPTWNAQHKFTPWVQGPDSAHIVWKEQGNLAGFIGGQAGQYGYTGAPAVHQ